MESGITPMTPLAEVPGSSVGRVQGLLDSTPLLWHVAVQDGAYLQLDDVVVTVRDVPGRGLVTTSGTISEIRARHEGASFGSDVFLISDGVYRPQSRRSPRSRRPGSSRSATSRRGRARPCAGPPVTNALRHCTSTGWTARFRWALAATARASMSTWISSTAPAVRIFRFPASPGSRRKRHSRFSCCTPCSAGTHCVMRIMRGHLSSRLRARICCSWTSPTGV